MIDRASRPLQCSIMQCRFMRMRFYLAVSAFCCLCCLIRFGVFLLPFASCRIQVPYFFFRRYLSFYTCAHNVVDDVFAVTVDVFLFFSSCRFFPFWLGARVSFYATVVLNAYLVILCEAMLCDPTAFCSSCRAGICGCTIRSLHKLLVSIVAPIV